MNEHFRDPARSLPLSRAEGLARTAGDLDRMHAAGLLGPADRVELVDGEIVPMAPKGNRHDVVKDALVEAMQERRPEGIRIAVESGWEPAPSANYEPDVRVFRRAREQRSMPGSYVLLVVEAADTTLDYDLGAKRGSMRGMASPNTGSSRPGRCARTCIRNRQRRVTDRFERSRRAVW